MNRTSMAWLVLSLLCVTDATRAQVAIQQPVVSQFGVNTSASVPDRGTARLGGVSRSAASRNRYGFWPRVGSSYGRRASHANVTATVTIHDLRAMDEYLLGLDSGTAPPVAPAITARGILTGDGGRVARRDPRGAGPRSIASTTTARPAAPPVTAAERSYGLGLRAEREGRAVVAKLHFESAARHGSAAARARLAERVVAE